MPVGAIRKIFGTRGGEQVKRSLFDVAEVSIWEELPLWLTMLLAKCPIIFGKCGVSAAMALFARILAFSRNQAHKVVASILVSSVFSGCHLLRLLRVFLQYLIPHTASVIHHTAPVIPFSFAFTKESQRRCDV